MLSTSQRVSRGAFKDVLTKGRSRVSTHLSFKYQRLGSGEKSRFSIVISKKVVKTAALRHLLKRRVYALLRELTAPQEALSGIFFAKAGVDRLSFKELSKEVRDLVGSVRRPE